MKKLEETIETNNRVYHLVKRTETKAFYKSGDGVMEVFKIKIAPAQTIYERDYPERECYPNSEDFGKIAWCYGNSEDLANKKYDSLK